MPSKVYFTRNITPENVLKLYEACGLELPGNVAVKLHSGEKGNQNFLSPEFWRPMIEHVHATVVECNTAYPGSRNTTAAHWQTMRDHGWSDAFTVDIMDEEGPDIFSWNKYIPIITPYFGNHISLFCLLMTITNIFYTKYNMEMTNTGQQQMPGMKAMMYMMPLMFLVFFNQYASGLTYYYFISTLITIVQTLIFRYTINEDKLLAKLEANKRKPMKKSGFMKRLEEAQRAQQETLRKQQEAKKKR